jgi:DNA-3-methyladenine glycosylase
MHDLCRGPGNLSRALGIGLSENWLDLEGNRLFLEDRGNAPGTIAWGPRVGLTVGTEHEWRCFVVGSRAVSGRRVR